MTSLEDSIEAFRLARPESSVAIRAAAPMATELYGRARPVAPWKPEADFGIWHNGTVAATEIGVALFA